MRKAMVTRTFKTLAVTATVLNTANNTVSVKELALSRVYPEKKILEKLQESYNTETEKVVHFTAFKEVEQLFGMTEQKFLENAVKLDAETRKEIEELPTAEN